MLAQLNGGAMEEFQVWKGRIEDITAVNVVVGLRWATGV